MGRSLIVLTIVAILGFSDPASPAVGVNGVGGELGYVIPTQFYEKSFAFGFIADLGDIGPGTNWDIGLTYWKSGPEDGWGGYYEDITLKTSMKYLFGYSGEMRPFIGAGISLHSITWETRYGSYSSQQRDTRTVWRYSLLGQMGMETPLSDRLKGQLHVDVIDVLNESKEIPFQIQINLTILYWIGSSSS